jgi:transcriptional regulator with XRE-family HTH domain
MADNVTVMTANSPPRHGTDVRRRDLLRQLIAARKANGLTQGAVATALGVRQSVVAEIESGRTDVRYSTLDRYGDVVSRGRLRLELVAAPDVDRSEIRRAIRMSDADRERYFLASNGNMLRMFRSGGAR